MSDIAFGGQGVGQPRVPGSYGDEITEARKAHGVTQQAFAAHVGLSDSTLGCIERGEMLGSRRARKMIDLALATLPEVAEKMSTKTSKPKTPKPTGAAARPEKVAPLPPWLRGDKEGRAGLPMKPPGKGGGK